MDVTEFARKYLLRRQATKLAPGPQPAPHPPRSGPEWDSSLATGIDRIDRQHRELMGEIESFQKDLKKGAGLRVLGRTLQLMIRYTEDHFTLEEAYMAHIRYPHIPAHREEHTRLRTRIEYLQQRLEKGDTAKALELSGQLCEHLRRHIVTDDAAYVQFARTT